MHADGKAFRFQLGSPDCDVDFINYHTNLCPICRLWMRILATLMLRQWWKAGPTRSAIRLSPSTQLLGKSPRSTFSSTILQNLGMCLLQYHHCIIKPPLHKNGGEIPQWCCKRKYCFFIKSCVSVFYDYMTMLSVLSIQHNPFFIYICICYIYIFNVHHLLIHTSQYPTWIMVF